MRPQDFGDVEGQIANTRGVLDDHAMRSLEQVIERANPEGTGFDFQVHCTNCGKPCVVTLPWNELIVASCRLVPLDSDSGLPWAAQGGFLYPPVRCGCNHPLLVPITPDKAARFVNTGISMQKLNPVEVDQHRRAALAQAPRR